MMRCGFAFDKAIERAGLPHGLYRLNRVGVGV
jgi:hypothetical protein